MLIVMNVVTVNEGRNEDFERAFKEHESHLPGVDGFKGFELLRRDKDDEYAVVTRWEDEDSFKAWVSSDAFRESHKSSDRSITATSEIRSYEVILTR